MSGKKEIQNRIKSVKNTKKVTKAMEMVAAAKMRRAMETVLRTRPYSSLSWEIILRLSESLNAEHPLLTKKNAGKTAIILFASNRGLCGGFNANALNKAILSIKKHNEDKDAVDFILIGKKGKAVYTRFGYNIAAEFEKPDTAIAIEEIMPTAKMIVKDFLDGKYKKVFLIYTDFVNAAVQTPCAKQILPVDLSAMDDNLGKVEHIGGTGVDEIKEKGLNNKIEYIFEPSPAEALDAIVPRLIEAQLFQALLESNASEHAARMVAMKQATDSAGDMIDELTLTFNKARQAVITQEIAEISAGVESMNE